MSNLVEELAGVILVADGLGSIVYSTDQRPLSNVGRGIRTIIGIGVFIDGARRQ